MINRDYKIFRQDCIYHIYNRGNNKDIIYHDQTDYEQFLKRLKLVLGQSNTPIPLFGDRKGRHLNIRPLPKGSFTILAYCLMPNHFHFLVRQNNTTGIDKLISKLCTSYAAYYNKRYERIGHVFQDAFKAKLVNNDGYITYLSAYIHNNPENVLTYPYSSFLDYTANRGGTICNKEYILSYFSQNPSLYRDFVLKYNKQTQAKIAHLLFEE